MQESFSFDSVYAVDSSEPFIRFVGQKDFGVKVKTQVANAISNGDLTVKIDVLSENDSFGKSFEKMVADLNSIVMKALSEDLKGRYENASKNLFNSRYNY